VGNSFDIHDLGEQPMYSVLSELELRGIDKGLSLQKVKMNGTGRFYSHSERKGPIQRKPGGPKRDKPV